MTLPVWTLVVALLWTAGMLFFDWQRGKKKH